MPEPQQPEGQEIPNARVVPNYAAPFPPANLVTVASFWSPVEANIAAEKLRGGGIICFLDGENFQAVTGGWYANTAGGVKLQVREEDAAAARASLPSPSSRPGPKCPNCGSHHTASDPPGCLLEVLAMLLIVPYMFMQVKHKCRDCGHRWVPPDDEEEEEEPEDQDNEAGG